MSLDSSENIFERLYEIYTNAGPATDEYHELDFIFRTLYRQVQLQLLPKQEIRHAWNKLDRAFSTATMQGFVVRKPHGYAGDYEIIDRIYTHWLSPETDLVRWDHYFHSRQSTKAVRKRKEYFKIQLEAALARSTDTISVLNLGSGPCRDVLEFFDLYNPENIAIDCFDLDENAIRYAKNLCNNYLDKINFYQQNVLRFKTDKKYSLIWSAGLFDYLSDKHFQTILRKLSQLLLPGGEIIIGNFSKDNPTRSYMEFGEWYLNHRSKEELISLALAAGFKAEKIDVKSEAENVNLFLHLS